MRTIFLIISILLWAQVGLCFRPFILHSGKGQVKLVEFYTSESCEKCDGPEKWLATLRADKGLWKKFAPISFHMATLNNADGGWVDIFSKPEFTKRIKDAADLPAFIVNGEEWFWSEKASLPLEGKTDEVGDLSVARNKMKEFEITFSPKEKLDSAEINVALLGNGISRKITLNSMPPTPVPSNTPQAPVTPVPPVSKTLEESFVILELVSKSLHKNGNTFSGHVDMKMEKTTGVKSYSAVFWTTKEEADPKPVQVTGGDLKLE